MADDGFDFSMLTLAELRVMLRDTLSVADQRDAEFIKALANEIVRRERQGEQP